MPMINSNNPSINEKHLENYADQNKMPSLPQVPSQLAQQTEHIAKKTLVNGENISHPQASFSTSQLPSSQQAKDSQPSTKSLTKMLASIKSAVLAFFKTSSSKIKEFASKASESLQSLELPSRQDLDRAKAKKLSKEQKLAEAKKKAESLIPRQEKEINQAKAEIRYQKRLLEKATVPGLVQNKIDAYNKTIDALKSELKSELKEAESEVTKTRKKIMEYRLSNDASSVASLNAAIQKVQNLKASLDRIG